MFVPKQSLCTSPYVEQMVDQWVEFDGLILRLRQAGLAQKEKSDVSMSYSMSRVSRWHIRYSEKQFDIIYSGGVGPSRYPSETGGRNSASIPRARGRTAVTGPGRIPGEAFPARLTRRHCRPQRGSRRRHCRSSASPWMNCPNSTAGVTIQTPIGEIAASGSHHRPDRQSPIDRSAMFQFRRPF